MLHERVHPFQCDNRFLIVRDFRCQLFLKASDGRRILHVLRYPFDLSAGIFNILLNVSAGLNLLSVVMGR